MSKWVVSPSPRRIVISPAARQGPKGADGLNSVTASGGVQKVGDDISLTAASVTSLAKADSATQPGDLADVATSGDYDDLTNKPVLGTAAAADTGDFATAAQGALADTAVQAEDLADVATSGELGDLSDVTLASPVKREVLAYVDGQWRNKLEADFKTVFNNTGSEIAEGTLVHITGSAGAVPLVTVADKDTDEVVSGIMVADIAAGTAGIMQAQGTLQDTFINTNGMTPGALLYLGDSGAYTTTKPTSGNVIIIGAVGVAASSNGSLILDCPGYKQENVTPTVHDRGTITTGTATPEHADGEMQKAVNDGAHTLAAMTAVGYYVLTYTNGSGAGAITATGWDRVDDADSVLAHTVENSVIECAAYNDGVSARLIVTLIEDATP